MYHGNGKIDANKAVENGKYPFFTCAREISRIDDAPYEGKVVLVAGNGDLNVKYYEGKFNAYQRTYFLTSLDESSVLPKYIYFFMEHYLQILRTQSIGTTVKYIKMENLTDAIIPLPAIDEQLKIVEFLEDHLSRLDAALADVKYAQTLNRNLVNSYLYRNLTDSDNNWEIRNLGDCADFVEYGTSTKTTDKIDDSYIPVLRMGNIQDGNLDWTSLKYLPSDSPEMPKLLLMTGDLLFNRTNSAELVGKSAVFDLPDTKATFASYLIRVRFKENTNPHWANFIINSGYGRAYINSVVTQQVGQANVNGSKLKNFPLPSPPRDVQDILVAEHLEVVERANRIKSTIKSTELQGVALRRSLLNAAFTGQLTNEVVSV